jgi:hypothetical protein
MSTEKQPESRVIQVPCIRCDAKVGTLCVQPGRNIALVGGFHKERHELANRVIPHFPTEEQLTSTEKALIAYYAFIMISDSVAAKSEEMTGKVFTTQEIQRHFAKMAIDQLRKDGLLK